MTEPALLEPPVSAPPTGRPDLADLILLRLLPEAKSVPPKKLREDLAVFFRRALSADEVGVAVAALRAEGYVTPKAQRATAAGRARALQFLGVANLPARANWGAVKAKYLVPKALGIPPDAAEYAKAVGKGETFAAFLLKRDLHLPDSAGRTLTAVVDALICRELGHPEFTKLNDLIAFALGRAIGGDPIAKAEAKKVLPRVRLNVTQLSTEKLFAVVLGGRIENGAARATERDERDERDEPFDLEMFANTVTSVARTCPTGWFGDNKVFINHVWNQLRAEPRFARLGLDGFKQKLIEANRADRLTLSRADLVQLMDPADVRASETTFLTAAFHFILVEKD